MRNQSRQMSYSVNWHKMMLAGTVKMNVFFNQHFLIFKIIFK